MSPITELKFQAAGIAAHNLGLDEILEGKIDNPDIIKNRAIQKLQATGLSYNEAFNIWQDEVRAAEDEIVESESLNFEF